jgi:hypothetical protein
VIDDESLVKTRTNTCLSYASAIPSYSVPVTSVSYGNFASFTTEFLAGKFVMFAEDKMIYFVCLKLERAFLFTKYPRILRYNDWLVL